MDGVLLDFFGEERLFFMNTGQIRALEEKFGLGHMEILLMLDTGRHFYDYITEIIRLGFIGAGKTADEAAVLTSKIHKQPTSTFLQHAQIILARSIYGSDFAEQLKRLKKLDGGAEAQNTSTPPPQTKPRRAKKN